MKYLYVLITIFLIACQNDCEINTYDCDNNVLTICNSDKEWVEAINCNDIEPKEFDWVCCLNQETCVPKEECK